MTPQQLYALPSYQNNTRGVPTLEPPKPLLVRLADERKEREAKHDE